MFVFKWIWGGGIFANLKLPLQDNISWSDIHKYNAAEGAIQSAI